MSKARCVNNEPVGKWLTIGHIYECLVDADKNYLALIDDTGEASSWHMYRFELLPDEPKAEWMQMTDNGQFATFVHMPTGLCVGFTKSTKKASIWSLHSDADETRIDEARADAFAALAGYTWKEG